MPRLVRLIAVSALSLAAFPGCAALREWASDPAIYDRIAATGEAFGHAVANPANPVPWVELGFAVVGLIGTAMAAKKAGERAERNKLGLDRIPIPNEDKARPSSAPK